MARSGTSDNVANPPSTARIDLCFRISSCIFIAVFLFLSACEEEKKIQFTRLPVDHSGIAFENTIVESPKVNILSYEYTYNGGGVAAGDFNNDGLCDLYFTGNAVSNRLYLNSGNLKFKDITEAAGVGGRPHWKTGVTSADVNGDGWLDIYVCYSGPDLDQSFSNQLFINNGIDHDGVPTFTERAEEYRLDAPGTLSTQASFFDYDKDGDLDMFLINHGNHFYSPFINTNKLRNSRHPQFGNRLYRNDAMVPAGSLLKSSHYFTEVSQEAGIHGGGLNFSLGLSVSDINNDSWPDIYVTNDYEEQDFLYLNNKDGTFTESSKKSFGHLSRNGMGTDIADFNNDGLPDLMEVDMWPEDNFRQKLLKGPDDYNRYTLMIDSGFHYQQMRNTLQLNCGNGPDGFPRFSEIGQLAGVSSTDWSWAPLFADLDNDGLKDLFVTNGYLRDFTSMDFLKYTVEEAKRDAQKSGKKLEVYDLVKKLPSTKTHDYVFQNKGKLTFTDNTKEWGMDEPNLSFGATYADLDNDGDLELITNNTNEVATVWENHGNQMNANNFLRIALKGPLGNPFGVGTKVYVETGEKMQMQELFPSRGYQSSVELVLHFGLGSYKMVEKILVIWPDDHQMVIRSVNANQKIELVHSDERQVEEAGRPDSPVLFHDVTAESKIEFRHVENLFVDFDREPLVPYQLSRLGPALSKGDVNGDGVDDFYVGGAAGQSGQLYMGYGEGHFSLANKQPWKADRDKEDSGSCFFDCDGDGDLDLFVVSGGNEFPQGSPLLDDRLYVNQGNGEFVKAPEASTPGDHVSGSCVTAADYDKDGDIDLFVGGRMLPGNFPMTSPGAVLRNESDPSTHTIKFVLATKDVNEDLREPGMVTDAIWTDYNGDTWPDLLIVGNWMPIRLFENQKGRLTEIRNKILENTSGLWNRIVEADIDGDGDKDYILGNSGNNLPWKVSDEKPLMLQYADFNDDGRIDPVISYSSGGKYYPVSSRDELLTQINSFRKMLPTYSVYAGSSVADIFDKTKLDQAPQLKVQTMETSVLENLGKGNFSVTPLPNESQVSSVNGIIAGDFNNDRFIDILLAGNFFPYRTQYGRSDAGMGALLTGNGKGGFLAMPPGKSRFFAQGDIRDMILLNGKEGRRFILLARNNDTMSLIEINDR